MNDLKTLDQLRRLIKRDVDPRLELAANRLGGKYYYFYSKDEELGNALCGLDTTSVLVYNWQALTSEQWLSEAREIMQRVSKEKGCDEAFLFAALMEQIRDLLCGALTVYNNKGEI